MASTIVVQSYDGPLTVNYEGLRGTIKGVLSGDTRGIRREKEGIAKVLAELSSCAPAIAASLGIGPDLLKRIADQSAQLAEIRAGRVILDKLAEVFTESEACLEDEREGNIGLVVDSVRRAARQNPNALVTFEETMRYHSQLGVRAAKTRVKNKKQAAGAGQPAQAQAPTPTSAGGSSQVDPKEAPNKPQGLQTP